MELLEGYGCTEMSPVVAVNAPDLRSRKRTQTGTKPGTVGHPLPGVAAKVVDPETSEPRAPDQEGLLLVKRREPHDRLLEQPEHTARGDARTAGIDTGDIAVMDEDGFMRITDRLSRFSKIGGEMVPHLKIEEAACGLIGEAPCAVTGVPDLVRGERLVLLYVSLDIDARRSVAQAVGIGSAEAVAAQARQHLSGGVRCRRWAPESWICARSVCWRSSSRASTYPP